METEWKPKPGWETLKMHLCVKHFASNMHNIFITKKELQNLQKTEFTFNSVLFSLLSKWQHSCLSRQRRQLISWFYGLSLKYRGKQNKAVTMKPDMWHDPKGR